MKKSVSIISLSAVALVAAGAVMSAPAWADNEVKNVQPVRAVAERSSADAFWAGAEFERDDDDNRRYGNLPRPSRSALSAIGMVRVLEVEWDDGLIEVEGLNARGQEIDAVMDRSGQRVIRYEVERWDD